MNSSKKSIESPGQIIRKLPFKARMVYYDLVCDEKRKRTRMEAARHLNIPKSTVYDYVRKMERCHVLKKFRKMTTDVFYCRGKNYALIEAYLKQDHEALRYNMQPNNVVVRGEMKAGYVPYVRAHLYGGWCSVKAECEGILEYYPVDFGDH